MPAKEIVETVKGFSKLNTDSVPSHLDKTELTIAENVVYEDDDTVRIRNGSKVYKNSTQNSSPVRESIDFDFGNGAFELYSRKDGTLEYNEVATYVDENTSFTEIDSVTGGQPALNSDMDAKVYFRVLNQKCFITDETSNLYCIDKDLNLVLVADPKGFEIEFTVAATEAIALDTELEEQGGTGRKFIVTREKVANDGTILYLRQIGGNSRPPSSGTLEYNSGANTVSYTDINYKEKLIMISTRLGRLKVYSDMGNIYVSATNDGADLTGSDTTRLNYGLENNLKLSNAISFKRATLVTAENTIISRSSIASVVGYRIPNLLSPTSEDLRVQTEDTTSGIFGRSAQEVGNSFIGLTRNGFISSSALRANFEFGLVDNSFISRDIQKLIKRVNWDYASRIVSTVDFNNQRYLCAVPMDDKTECSSIFVYDFKNSKPGSPDSPAIHKWSIFTYELGTADISHIFTLKGKPFIADTEGNIHETEIYNYYYDNGNVYKTQIQTKAFDFNNRFATKQFKSTRVDFLVKEEKDIEIFTVTDEQINWTDYKGNSWDMVTLKPRELEIPSTEVNSNSSSPFEMWESNIAQELSVPIAEVENGLQMAIRIRDKIGGKYWGVSGVSVTAVDNSESGDHRIS